MRQSVALAVVVATLTAASTVAQAQSYGVYGAEQFFTLEWAAGQSRGRPVISGYVTNHYGFGARNVRLQVEALDADGKVVDTTIGYVPSDVPPLEGRAYFEVRLPQAGAAYRVRVLSWDWKAVPGM